MARAARALQLGVQHQQDAGQAVVRQDLSEEGGSERGGGETQGYKHGVHAATYAVHGWAATRRSACRGSRPCVRVGRARPPPSD